MIVVTQPYVPEAHKEQQANLAAMMKARFGADAGESSYVNLGDAIDMTQRDVAYDGLHLTAQRQRHDCLAPGGADQRWRRR